MPKTLILLKSSIVDAWRLRASLWPIILVVMIPTALLGLLLSGDQTLGGYASFATLVMNLAVVWGVIKLKTGTTKLSLTQAYYAGTTRLVAFVGVLALMSLQMIPFLLGGLIYLSGSTGATVGLSTPEKALLGLVWLLIASPSLRWVTRSIFALYLVQDAAVRPIAAVRGSNRLVRGQSWLVFGRLLAGVALLFVVLIVPSLAIASLPDSASWLVRIATALLQILASLALVSFASIYGYNILEALGGKPKAS